MKKPQKRAVEIEKPADVIVPSAVVGANQIGVDKSPDITPIITAEDNQRRANKAHHSERYSAPKK